MGSQRFVINFLIVAGFIMPVARTVWASGDFDPVINQFLTDRVNNKLFSELAHVKSGQDAKKILLAQLSKQDQKSLRPYLDQIKIYPKFERLNRGFAYTFGGRKYQFVVKDILRHKFRVNDKTDWSYESGDALIDQVRVVAHNLQKDLYSRSSIFVETANAQVAAIVVGVIVGGILIPIVSKAITDYVFPLWDTYNCQDRDPNNYKDYMACKAYFDHQAAARPKIPTANLQTPDTQRDLPTLEAKPKCPTKDDPDFVLEIQNQENTTKVKRTIKYGPDAKPREMEEESIIPGNRPKIVYTLNSSGQLLKVEDGAKLFLSRDPKDSDQMTASKLKEMEQYDAVISSMIGFLKFCDGKTQKDLEAASERPGSLLASTKSAPPPEQSSSTTPANH